jgi:hypothetical protein
MTTRYLVEDSFAITPKDVLRSLKPFSKRETANKCLNMDVDYWLEDPADPFSLYARIRDQKPQKLPIETVFITFGEVMYFNCDCGYRVAKLYLPPDGTRFKCKKCHKLQYRLSTLNPKSVAGLAIYKANRINKLMETRESINRIFYRGKFTKRFSRFLGLCDKAGLKEVVDNAQRLLEVIKTQ